MVQEVRVIAWCDVHKQRDDLNVEGRTRTYTVDGVEVEIDTCDGCYVDGGLAAFVSTISTYGRPVDKGAALKANGAMRRPGRLPDSDAPERKVHCLLCEWFGWSGSGLQNHIRTEHSVHDVITMTGNDCPLCGAQWVTLGSLSQHMSKTHGNTIGTEGWRHVTRALWLLMRQGAPDPHGVLAARKEWIATMTGLADALPLDLDGGDYLPISREHPLVNVAAMLRTAHERAAMPTTRVIAETCRTNGVRTSHTGVARALQGSDRTKWVTIQAIGHALNMTDDEHELLRTTWNHDMQASGPAR
jgi:hypothetical protein